MAGAHEIINGEGAGSIREAQPQGAARGRPALPCLNRNNSTEQGRQNSLETRVSAAFEALSTKHKKSASALAWNVEFLAKTYGLGRLGFLTLTFAENILDPREAQRRFNSLATHVLRTRYSDHIRVWERTKKGRIHYHLLVVLPDDIREGVSFSDLAAGNYQSAGSALRAEWAFWRKTAKLYGFGRTELLPVKSTAEGIAKYVGKYIAKHVQQREERDKGFRLVEYSRGARMASARFTFVSDGSARWRRKLALFSAIVAADFGVDHISFSELSSYLGPKWAYTNRPFILGLPD